MKITEILTTTLLFVALVGGVLLASIPAWVGAIWWSRRPPLHLRRVLLSLRSTDHVLRGVLWRVRGDWYTLRDAALLHPDGRVVPMDGEVVVHRQNVLFAQVPTYGGEQLRNPG